MNQIFAYKGRGFVPLMSTLQSEIAEIERKKDERYWINAMHAQVDQVVIDIEDAGIE